MLGAGLILSAAVVADQPRTGGQLDPAQAWRTLALLAGLLASVFMVMQVLLMARIPWIERAWGHDVLARRHRWLGFWSFGLMMAHIGLETIEHLRRMPSAPGQALLTCLSGGPGCSARRWARRRS